MSEMMYGIRDEIMYGLVSSGPTTVPGMWTGLLEPGREVNMSRIAEFRHVPLRFVSHFHDRLWLVDTLIGSEPVTMSGSTPVWAYAPDQEVSSLPNLKPTICEVGMEISLRLKNISTEQLTAFGVTVVAYRLEPGETLDDVRRLVEDARRRRTR